MRSRRVSDRPTRLIGILAVSALLLLPACKAEPTGLAPTLGPIRSGAPPVSPSSSVANVSIQDFAFLPPAITIKVGTTVQWTNNGPSPHTTTSDGGAWASGALTVPSGMESGGGTDSGMGSDGMGGMPAGGMAGGSSEPGGSFRFTFMQPGTYKYHCAIHPPRLHPGFTGTVTVTR